MHNENCEAWAVLKRVEGKKAWGRRGLGTSRVKNEELVRRRARKASVELVALL